MKVPKFEFKPEEKKSKFIGLKITPEMFMLIKKYKIDVSDLCRFAIQWKINQLKK